jgi:hypothetical protein
MSRLEELGARLRETAGDLPVGHLAGAADRLRGALDLLAWIRHDSARGIGVAQLEFAVEHLEHALRSMIVAQEDVATYLTAIGLTGEASVAAESVRGSRLAAVDGDDDALVEPAEAAPLRRWWTDRVDMLTGYRSEHADPVARPAPAPSGRSGQGSNGSTRDRAAATDSTELLHRMAEHVGNGDRDRLRTDLRRVAAVTGLGLSALTPTALRRLAGEILGHPPGPEDLPAVRSATGGRIHDLLPNIDPQISDVLLARTCRVPVEPSGDDGQGAAPTHPADSAIAGGVLTGLMLRRAGRDPSVLDRFLGPEPVRA